MAAPGDAAAPPDASPAEWTLRRLTADIALLKAAAEVRELQAAEAAAVQTAALQNARDAWEAERAGLRREREDARGLLEAEQRRAADLQQRVDALERRIAALRGGHRGQAMRAGCTRIALGTRSRSRSSSSGSGGHTWRRAPAAALVAPPAPRSGRKRRRADIRDSDDGGVGDGVCVQLLPGFGSPLASRAARFQRLCASPEDDGDATAAGTFVLSTPPLALSPSQRRKRRRIASAASPARSPTPPAGQTQPTAAAAAPHPPTQPRPRASVVDAARAHASANTCDGIEWDSASD